MFIWLPGLLSIFHLPDSAASLVTELREVHSVVKKLLIILICFSKAYLL